MTTKTKKSAKKAPTPKKATKVVKAKGPRQGKFPLTAKITLLTKENPHRPTSNLRDQFARYKSGMTVQEALAAGVVWANFRYLVDHEHIKIG